MSIITRNIIFTESAIKRINIILEQEKNKNVLFRIKVEGGGCAGFQYKFDLDYHNYDHSEEENDDQDDLLRDENLDEEDYIVQDNDGMTIAVIDKQSLNHLKNCELDYVEDLTKSTFVVNNPKAVAKCGCGSSFNV